ncbi:hypothetical protein ISS05_02345 [Candidatus Woesearchaeota archaeon]|nr:hypothetical protein [Candidatus Woesearchaeota archaeon]
MDELDQIRQKKIEQLQRSQQEKFQQTNEESQMQLQIEQLESIVKQALTKDALQRFGNLKAAHPEKAMQLLAILAQALQQGQISQIDDNTLKEILIKITPEKKEFKIKKI